MLPNNKFTGELNGKTIKDFRNQINYNISYLDERIKDLYKILYTENNNTSLDMFFEEYFEQSEDRPPYFKVELNQNDSLSNSSEVCKALEQMANYILFSDECKEQNVNSEYPYLNNNDRLASKRREDSYDEMLEGTDEKHGLQFEKELGKKRNVKLKPKMKITKQDIAENPYIKELQEQIDYYYKVYKNEESKGKEKDGVKMLHCSKTMKALRQEQIEIKYAMNRPIDLKGLLKDETVPDYDSDTGYYVDEDYVEVSTNRIDLGNPKHVYALLKNYQELKQGSFENFNSDMKYILQVVEEMIAKTDISDIDRDILILKIDKINAKEICNFILKKYEVEINEKAVSRIFTTYIPRKVAETYLSCYAEWFYTYKAKGNYKKCNKCNRILLADSNNFSKNNSNKDRLSSMCRKCSSKKRD